MALGELRLPGVEERSDMSAHRVFAGESDQIERLEPFSVKKPAAFLAKQPFGR